MTTRILLVDDTPDDRALAGRELHRHIPDVAIVEAADGVGLASALGAIAPDLVITDFRLRWTDGLVVLRQVKAVAPDCPVIMFTSTGSEAVAVEGMKAGLDDYVIKSAKSYLALVTSARTALDRAAARRRAQIAERERDRLVVDLQRALDARDRFLQVASHELRNPLNGLVLQLEALRRDPQVPAAPKVLDRIERAAEHVRRLVELIERLIEFARITSGGVPLRAESLDLAALVRGVIARAEPELRRSGCVVMLDAPRPVVGRWDRSRLEQVVSNLVSNAAKFGAGHPVRVSVLGGSGAARLSVADHGIGIAREDHERIFRRFERAVPVENYGGFGLGLAIARELVESMGGRIEVASEPGAGATFSVNLPLDPGEAAAA